MSPPSLTNIKFQENFEHAVDKSFSKYDNLMVIGDLNFNMLIDEKCQALNSSCDIFDLVNVIKEPTCFSRDANPTLLDVALTNNRNLICNTCNFDCGLSDCHNFIGTRAVPVNRGLLFSLVYLTCKKNETLHIH